MFLVALAYLDHTRTVLAIALLTVGVAISGSAYSGYLINHIDLAPKYSGTLFGISNCIAATSGFIAPYIAAKLTPNVRVLPSSIMIRSHFPFNNSSSDAEKF